MPYCLLAEYAKNVSWLRLSLLGKWGSLTLLVKLYIWLHISFCNDLIPLALWFITRGGGLSILCQSFIFCSQKWVLKTFPLPDYLRSEDGVVWLWHLLVHFYTWLSISSSYASIPFVLGLIMSDGGLSTLCHSYWVFFQHRVVKSFPGPGYLPSEGHVAWLWYLLVTLYISLTISSCYSSVPLASRLIKRDDSFSTLFQCCWFAGRQRVLKTFPGYPGSKNEVVCLTMTFKGKYLNMVLLFILLQLTLFGLRVDRVGWWLEHSLS